jgi:cytochrome P450
MPSQTHPLHPMAATPPRPPGYPIVGVLPLMARDPLACMRAAAPYGDVVALGLNHYLINNPDAVEYVQIHNHRNYCRASSFRQLRPLVGDSLVSIDGESWLRQRRLMQPAFHFQRIAALADIITATAAAMLDRWSTQAELDVRAEMSRCTLEMITRVMFHMDVSTEADAIGHAFKEAADLLVPRIFALIRSPMWLRTPTNRRISHSLADLDTRIDRLIAERRQQPLESIDLLSMLLEARDEETGEGMSDVQLRDEVKTIFLAGHDTTASGLTWVWYLLATHPEAARQLRAELADVLGGRAPTAIDLPRLAYTRQVVDEALRLYPPSWITSRMNMEDDELGGYRIPAKSVVTFSPYLLHRNPTYFPEPEQFRPQRHTPEQAAQRPRYAYAPFNGGPRMCIGYNLALMEMVFITAMVAQRYTLELVSGQTVVPYVRISLRPRDPLRMIVRPVCATK